MTVTPDIRRPVTPQPKRMASKTSLLDEQEHNTLPDPRMRSLSPCDTDGPASPQHHPDLDQELATLSTKLINAINHSTTLDDTLSETRQELDSSRERVKELELLVARQQETLSGDVWIKRQSAEEDKHKLLVRITHEKNLRADVEKEKRKIEQELETLTVSLFEEANKMVISAKEDAKKEQDALHRKNEQLRAQLSDTEVLLKSQQEQLAELKLVMGQMTHDHEEHTASVGTAPSSPGHSRIDPREDDSRLADGVSQSDLAEPGSPTYATGLSHLVHPILRTDISAYDDFVILARTSKREAGSRTSSGSFTGFNALGLGGSGSAPAPSNASTASLSTASGAPSSNASPLTPNTPASAVTNGSSAPLPALKETKFYKRALAEDIEPTLRLDTAPGLSWLARRSVISAISEGTLVVEPVPVNGPFATISNPRHYPCSLCGETRKDAAHTRDHRFRTSEAETSQRYPLCKYCLHRVRSTCDYLGFLRMIKDGHWRADDSDAEKAAWEESVKLREQMFWSRIGGGLIPSQPTHSHSGSVGESVRDSQDVARTSADNERSPKQNITPGLSPPINIAVPSQPQEVDQQKDGAADQQTEQPQEDPQPAGDETAELSKPSTPAPEPCKSPDAASRLSITIPGAFAVF